MLSEASRVLRPGGSILLGEWIHLPVDSSTGTTPPGVAAFCQALDSSLFSVYGISNIPPDLIEYVSQSGGFTGIQYRDYHMPIGDCAWSSPHAKDLGIKFRQTLQIWADSAVMVIERAGYDEDEIKRLVDGFKEELVSVAGLQITYRVVTAHPLA